MVTPAEPLMIIVPQRQRLEVEAMVLNRDIGFVTEGQPATIKVDAFPFTRYGVLRGELTDVSNDDRRASASLALACASTPRNSISRPHGGDG